MIQSFLYKREACYEENHILCEIVIISFFRGDFKNPLKTPYIPQIVPAY